MAKCRNFSIFVPVKYFADFGVNQANVPKMKNKFLAALLLIITAVTVTSCYSSRKSGCPANPQASYRFRG